MSPEQNAAHPSGIGVDFWPSAGLTERLCTRVSRPSARHIDQGLFVVTVITKAPLRTAIDIGIRNGPDSGLPSTASSSPVSLI